MNKNHTKQVELSNVFLPVIFSKSDLERVINEQIDGTLFDEKITEGGFKIQVSKASKIRLSIQETTIFYSVPLRIWLRKQMILGDIEAQGDIVINFKTILNIGSEWTVSAKTQIVDYKWLSVPKASLMGLKIPVRNIAETVIRRLKQQVTDTIDKQVNDHFVLKQYATSIWQMLQNPMLVSADYQTRFKFIPKQVTFAPFLTESDTILSTLHIQGSTEINVGATDTFLPNSSLSPLTIQDINGQKEAQLVIQSKIPLGEVQKVVLQQFRGQNFQFGAQGLQFEGLLIEKVGEVLQLKVRTSGSYEGWLTLVGTPNFDTEKNTIQLKDVSFQLDTSNITVATPKWSIQGPLTNQLAGDLTYHFEEDLTNLKTILQQQMNQTIFQKGVHVLANIRQIRLQKAYFTETALLLTIRVEGTVKVLVERLTINEQ
ncbi:MAG: DUF4403 family protein [Bacteroidota bacterium]